MRAGTIGRCLVKAYVVTTGAVFGLLVVVHLWKAVEEGPRIATDPWFIVITSLAGGFCFWAWRVLRMMTTS
jgi:hypothetical protein